MLTCIQGAYADYPTDAVDQLLIFLCKKGTWGWHRVHLFIQPHFFPTHMTIGQMMLKERYTDGRMDTTISILSTADVQGNDIIKNIYTNPAYRHSSKVVGPSFGTKKTKQVSLNFSCWMRTRRRRRTRNVYKLNRPRFGRGLIQDSMKFSTSLIANCRKMTAFLLWQTAKIEQHLDKSMLNKTRTHCVSDLNGHNTVQFIRVLLTHHMYLIKSNHKYSRLPQTEKHR